MDVAYAVGLECQRRFAAPNLDGALVGEAGPFRLSLCDLLQVLDECAGCYYWISLEADADLEVLDVQLQLLFLDLDLHTTEVIALLRIHDPALGLCLAPNGAQEFRNCLVAHDSSPWHNGW